MTTKIHQEITSVYGEQAMSSHEQDIIEAIRHILDSDRWLTLDEIVLEFHQASRLTAYLSEMLLSKISSIRKCVRDLSHDCSTRTTRNNVDATRQFFHFFKPKQMPFFLRYWQVMKRGSTTGHLNQTKSMVWHKKDKPTPKKAKVFESVGKVICTIFGIPKGFY